MRLFLDETHFIDTSEPLDISIPIENSEKNPRAWYVDAPKIEPVRTDDWTGSVKEGGSVNFRNIFFNPHGHGTHTECLGHITEKIFSVNDTVKQFFFWAEVLSVEPQKTKHSSGELDEVITQNQIAIHHPQTEALIIRTLPNSTEKKSKNYSATNPPYFEEAIVNILDKNNIHHFLVDTPSVDRENDNGALAFHHHFWKVPQENNTVRTITELIFVDSSIEDGQYILELQVAPFVNDASPSRPVLYRVQRKCPPRLRR